MTGRRWRHVPWWVVFFFLVGVLTTLGVTLGLFFSLGRRPVQLSAPGVPAVSSEHFLNAVAGSTGSSIHTGGSIELLNNGGAFYPAMLEAIRDDLLSAGVRIYEYQPTFMHAKLLVVDGEWTVVGSANMDVRSKELNEENVLGLLDDRFGRAVEATFFADLARAREIRLEEWRTRSAWARIFERGTVLFAEQF